MTTETDKYKEWLSAIMRTCLVYNDKESMGVHLGLTLENNGFKGKNAIANKAKFQEVAEVVRRQTYNTIELENFLIEYEKTSDFFKQNLKRSYSMDITAAADDIPERKKKQMLIFAMLDYGYGYEIEQKIKLSPLLNSKRDWIKAVYEKELNIPILLLLLTGILPLYTEKRGAVEDIFADLSQLIRFLKEYAQQSAASDFFGSTPYLYRFETIVNLRREEAYDTSDVLNRISLVYLVTRFLGKISSFSNHQNILNTSRKNELVFPDICGIWVEQESVGTNFWKFEEGDNCYWLTYYRYCHQGDPSAGSNGPCYLSECYEANFSLDEGYLIMQVGHPKVRTLISQNHSYDEWLCWCIVKDTTESTKLHSAEGELSTTLIFLPTYNPNNWFKPRHLYRVQNNKPFCQKLERIPVFNKYEKEDVTITPNGFAITPKNIYLKLGEKDRMALGVNQTESQSPRLMKIPKTIDPALGKLTLDDRLGLVKTHDDRCFFRSAVALFSIEVTTDADRHTPNGIIELVDSIDIDE